MKRKRTAGSSAKGRAAKKSKIDTSRDSEVVVAVLEDKVEEVKQLITANPQLLHEMYRITPSLPPTQLLYVASICGSPECLKYFLELGAKADLKDEGEDSTPLCGAAVRGKTDCVLALLAGPPSSNVMDTIDTWSRKGLMTPLIAACSRSDVTAVKALLAAGADIYKTNFKAGESPLHLAAHKNCPEIIDILIAAGSDPNRSFCVVNGVTNSPLSTAITAGSNKAVAQLLKHGADVNARRPTTGATPLYIASDCQNTVAVELLLAHHADPNLVRYDGASPILIACEKGFVDVAERLIANGADPNIQTDTGDSPLMSAIITLQADAVRLLISHKASLHLLTSTFPQDSCLSTAIKMASPPIIHLITQALLDEWSPVLNAIVCGLHPRCGASSPLFLLSSDLHVLRTLISFLFAPSVAPLLHIDTPYVSLQPKLHRFQKTVKQVGTSGYLCTTEMIRFLKTFVPDSSQPVAAGDHLMDEQVV